MHLPWRAEAFASAIARGRAGVRGARAVAVLGALEPRPASPPHALRRLGGARSRGGRAAPHAARDAVPLRRRGARPARRRGTRDGARGSRRSRRLAGADSLGRDAAPRLAGRPWLPWPPEPERRNAESESDDPDSILALYRRLLAIRRSSPALELGNWLLLDSPAGHARLRALPARATFAGSPSTSATGRVGRRRSADGWNVELTTGAQARRPALGRIPRAGRGGHSRRPDPTPRD